MGYEDAKIYMLTCDDGCYYYGSTIQSLKERLWHHKESSKKLTSKVYSHIRTLGWDKVTIALVQSVSCANRKELRVVENTYIQSKKDDPKCLNTLRAYTSEEEKAKMEKERQTKNADRRKEVVHAYYESHKDTLTERHKTYYQEHKEEFAARSRAYNESHKAEITEQRKRHYEENKDRLCREKREKRAREKAANGFVKPSLTETQ
jgi:predicted GIY-YIG superfamily endonuclease